MIFGDLLEIHPEGRKEASLPFREESGGLGPPAWCVDYVGIPFKSGGRDRAGCDCYGLVALVLRERFRTIVPSYAGEYADALEQAEVAALIAGEIGTRWIRTSPRPATYREGVPSEGEAGEVILLRIAGEPWHVGIVVAERWFLHVRPGANACLERWDSMRWRRRVCGFFFFDPGLAPLPPRELSVEK